jgi:hypothetical protein
MNNETETRDESIDVQSGKQIEMPTTDSEQTIMTPSIFDQVLDRANAASKNHHLVLEYLLEEDEWELFAVHISTPDHLHKAANVLATLRAEADENGVVGPHRYIKGKWQEIEAILTLIQ